MYLALFLALVAFLAPFYLSFLGFLLFVFFFWLFTAWGLTMVLWMDDLDVVFAMIIYDHDNLYDLMRLCMYVDAVYDICVCSN